MHLFDNYKYMNSWDIPQFGEITQTFKNPDEMHVYVPEMK